MRSCYRSYAVRRIRDGFRSSRSATGEEAAQLRKKAQDSLQLIRRQVHNIVFSVVI